MAVLEDLSTYLTNQGTVGGGTGWAVFRDFMPAEPDRVVVLTETPGEPREARVGMDTPHVQVRVRSDDDETGSRRVAAREKAEDVYDLLHGFSGALGATHYVGIYALQSPFFLGVDENGRYAYAVNFRVLRGQSARVLDLPGTSGNYASTPDSAAVSITGDIDLRARIAPNDWTPSGDTGVVGPWDAAGSDFGYTLVLRSTGAIAFWYRKADDSGGIFPESSVAPSVSDGEHLWVRATRDASTGDVTFYTSADGASWTQLGAVQSTPVESMRDSTAEIEIGSHSQGTGALFAGKVYRAQIYDGVDGTLVFDVDFTDLTTFDGTDAWTDKSSNAATVTANGSDWTYRRA